MGLENATTRIVKPWRRAPAVRRPTAAVLAIDLQNDFCHPAGAFGRLAGLKLSDLSGLVTAVNRLVVAARSKDRSVIWLRMVWSSTEEMGLLRDGFLRDEGLRAGTWGAELLEELDVRPSDIQFTKTRFSGFFRTGLEDLLLDRGIRRLIVAGVRTDYCVESTVRDAFFRDFEVCVPRECTAGYFDDFHENSLREMDSIFADVLSLEETLALL